MMTRKTKQHQRNREAVERRNEEVKMMMTRKPWDQGKRRRKVHTRGFRRL